MFLHIYIYSGDSGLSSSGAFFIFFFIFFLYFFIFFFTFLSFLVMVDRDQGGGRVMI